jgi:hypothetical protein
MKITKTRLKQLIAEELQDATAPPVPEGPGEESGMHGPDFSEYELSTMDTDHQTVALLKEVVAQLKMLTQYMTPAKDLADSAAEKAVSSYAVAEAKKRQDPKFQSGDRVKHKEYGKGTVTSPGAAPDPGEDRRVSVKWDEPDRVPGGNVKTIEPSLTKI